MDNTAVYNSQIARLKKLKAERNQVDVDKALEEITNAAKTGEGNLLDLAVKAARVRATLGEISDAMEKVYGRHQAVIRSIQGVYSREVEQDPNFKKEKEWKVDGQK